LKSPINYETRYWHDEDEYDNKPVSFFKDIGDVIDNFKEDFAVNEDLNINDDLSNDGNDGTILDIYHHYDQEFNISDEIDHLLRAKSSNVNNMFPEINAYDVPLYEGSNVSAKEFTDKMLSHLRKHNASPDLISSLFEIIHESIPILSLNLRESSYQRNSILDLIKLEKDPNSYPDSIQVLTYDICYNGCMVYTEHSSKHCKKCRSLRFKPCSLCSRSYVNYNIKSNDNCPHTNRVPYKQLKYRCITPLLIELIKFKSFRQLINYTWDYDKNNETHDVSDREKFTTNKNEMHDIYVKHCESKKLSNVEEISILISWFYDGIQLFKKKTAVFQPLLITILNLPPIIRHVMGIGTFLLSLSMFKGDSNIEIFLLEDCFLEELLFLNKGLPLKIDGKDYFLQVRNIDHVFDLATLCPILKLQAFQSSKAGCMLCNIGTGTSIVMDKTIKARNNHIVKYVDARLPLPLRHYLKSNGLSRNCCPKCDDSVYNDQSKFFIPETFEKSTGYNRNEVNRDMVNLCFENEDISNNLNAFLYSNKLNWVWFNHEINYAQIRNHLYFLTCDYRVTEYQFVSKEAIMKIDKKRKDESVKALNGVMGQCFLFRLPYFRLETDICVEPDHALKCFLLDVVFKQMWQDGDQLRSNKIRLYYNKIGQEKGIGMFPLIFKEKDPKCSLLGTERNFIQNTLKCVLIPKGCTNKLHFAEFKIFDTASFLGIADVITIFSVYMDLILLCAEHMHNVYKSYYRILSLIVRKIIAPYQLIENIEPLFWRITEFRALTEGLFPVVCMSYMLHSLQCIAKHILLKGPICSFTALRGETNISKVKRLVQTSGGLKYEQLAYKKVFHKEAWVMKDFYENFGGKTDFTIPFLHIDKSTGVVDYSFQRSFINKETKPVYLSDYELDQLLHFIKTSIEERYVNKKERYINSSVYRVLNIVERKRLSKFETNRECLHRIYTILIEQENKIISAIIRNNCKEMEEKVVEDFINIYIRKENLMISENIYECLIRLKNNMMKFNVHNNVKEKQYTRFIEILVPDKDLQSVYKKLATSSLLNKYIYYKKYHQEELFRINNEDNLLTCYDFLTLRIMISLRNNISVSLRATANGTQHYGRGFFYSEKEYCHSETNNHIPTNSLNNLSESWFNTQQISSWCKIGNDVYGQLNYFFTLTCIVTDPFVSKLMIAAITLRRAIMPDYKNNETPPIRCINLKRPQNSANLITTSWKKHDQCFINIEKILPTRVATIGLSKYKDIHTNTVRYLPILSKNHTISQSDTNMKEIICQDEDVIIDFLGLIDVSPEKIKEDETINIQTIQEMNNFE